VPNFSVLLKLHLYEKGVLLSEIIVLKLYGNLPSFMQILPSFCAEFLF